MGTDNCSTALVLASETNLSVTTPHKRHQIWLERGKNCKKAVNVEIEATGKSTDIEIILLGHRLHRGGELLYRPEDDGSEISPVMDGYTQEVPECRLALLLDGGPSSMIPCYEEFMALPNNGHGWIPRLNSTTAGTGQFFDVVFVVPWKIVQDYFLGVSRNIPAFKPEVLPIIEAYLQAQGVPISLTWKAVRR